MKEPIAKLLFCHDFAGLSGDFAVLSRFRRSSATQKSASRRQKRPIRRTSGQNSFAIGSVKTLLFPVLLVLFLAGCSTDISVTHIGAPGRLEYGSRLTSLGISEQTNNTLANFLLEEDFEERPFEFVTEMEQIFRREPQPEYLAALADSCLNIGLRMRRDADTAIRFYLSGALYSYAYLVELDQPSLEPYNAERLAMLRIYNLSISELFGFLNDRGLALKSAFSLTAAGGQRVNFGTPEFELKPNIDFFHKFHLCADYRTKNLTHISRSFGIGVPLICEHRILQREGGARSPLTAHPSLAGTLVVKFKKEQNREIAARLEFIDSRNRDTVKVGKYEFPLEQDFSTPIAFMVRDPMPFDYLTYMLRPDRTQAMQGLYILEPFHEERIPVVLVHGLLSNIRTWVQMINTLQSDPELRKYYQFWGFTYSSGNPVLYSAKMLRDSLNRERDTLAAQGHSMKMFDRMILIGHSMGGLVAKTAILNVKDELIQPVLGEKYKEKFADLDKDQQEFVRGMVTFTPLPYVRRVVFIAVPHRGSDMATSWFGRFASNLIDLPTGLITRGDGILKTLMAQGVFMPKDFKVATGIGNLDPGDRAMTALNTLPFAEGVKTHSIIGNRREKGVPGGSDGIVPYLSSHLDSVESELVVKSGHSVQQNALAIQELRRILVEHLKQYPDIKIEAPQLPAAVEQR